MEGGYGPIAAYLATKVLAALANRHFLLLSQQTDAISDVPIELGAMWLHYGEDQRHPFTRICKEANFPLAVHDFITGLEMYSIEFHILHESPPSLIQLHL